MLKYHIVRQNIISADNSKCLWDEVQERGDEVVENGQDDVVLQIFPLSKTNARRIVSRFFGILSVC